MRQSSVMTNERSEVPTESVRPGKESLIPGSGFQAPRKCLAPSPWVQREGLLAVSGAPPWLCVRDARAADR
ncbi:hypothetical protein NDU88_000641 [Pleurodeles waltl]|uniref:Uncharacterized protein n=1 Tax=Pleurodeles waltl TaxID=8319 RepID=A0AAV7Q3G5_PLEWA|nr:hypothetical protein NDU88_000641 [Pleurodeles waltl]